jgi:hypothetical protein
VPLSIDAIRECLDGAIPGVIATCAADGTPNVTFVSEVHFVDAQHVALSFQFFNKTRENVLASRRACVLVTHPETAARYRLTLEYLRTETEGPLFESMKAKLAGIASHTGMAGVFRLLGSDVYRVHGIEHIPGQELPVRPKRNLLSPLRTCVQRLTACTDLAGSFDETLSCLESLFDIHYAMVLMLDRPGRRLYTVASRGYDESGVGSEIPLGQGVIGVAARERTPIRITHMTADYAYGRAIRASLERDQLAGMLETEIPLPGLPQSRSQLAVPILVGGDLVGVLYVESPEDLRYGYDDEDALVAVAAQLGMAMDRLRDESEAHEAPAPGHARRAPVSGTAALIRHYGANDSVFVGEDYLIKGVAGAIFWKLLRDYVDAQRTEFTNRELRLDPALRLPDISDNLEARLILLERRLAERCPFLRLEKTGRGRFRLNVGRPVQLVEVPAGDSPR